MTNRPAFITYLDMQPVYCSLEDNLKMNKENVTIGSSLSFKSQTTGHSIEESKVTEYTTG